MWYIYENGKIAHYRPDSGGESPASCGVGDYPDRRMFATDDTPKCLQCAVAWEVRKLISDAIEEVENGLLHD